MDLKFPTDCVTLRDRAEYAQIAKRKAIEAHNAAVTKDERRKALGVIHAVATEARKTLQSAKESEHLTEDQSAELLDSGRVSVRWNPDLKDLDASRGG